jgi:tripartite ATP-independent transporter DctP family solute receptor
MKNILGSGKRVQRRDFLKLSLAGGAAAAAGISAPAIAQGVKTWRFGHMMPNDNIYHRAIAMFADEVNKLSDKKIKVDIFPASQLGTIAEMLQSVQAGSLTMSMAVPAWYSNHMKPVDAFTLPYLVSNHEKLKAALDGKLGKEVERMGEGVGFKIFGYWLLGSRHIVNRIRAVNKPEDCKGLKLRVINSQVYMQTFRALGANPVAMDPSELYLAMQQGVIDGFEYPLPDLLVFKLNEVSKFVSLDAHTTDFFLISTSPKNWAAFSNEEREIINKSMKTAMDWQWKIQPDDINNALAKLKTVMAVNEITPENKKLFVEATLPVHKQFESSIGRDFLELAIKELT